MYKDTEYLWKYGVPFVSIKVNLSADINLQNLALRLFYSGNYCFSALFYVFRPVNNHYYKIVERPVIINYNEFWIFIKKSKASLKLFQKW